MASLTNVVEHSQAIWGSVGMCIEDTRFETDTDGRLKLTLKPHAQVVKDWQMAMHRALKLTGARSVLTLVFPGKVVSSSLTVIEGNSTGLVLDGNQEATIAAAAKVFATPVTIIGIAAMSVWILRRQKTRVPVFAKHDHEVPQPDFRAVARPD